MKTTFAKLLALCLALMMMLSLFAACANTEDDPKDTTAAETTVKAPEETTGTNAGTTDKKGCGSVVGGTIALIVSVACGAMLIARKKED